MLTDSDLHQVLQRLTWAGGSHLLFDKEYHGRTEMRAVERAVRMGYAVRVQFDRSPVVTELCITPTGRRALADLNQKQSDAHRGRALFILRCRNAIRSSHIPFRRALLRSTDKALKRVRIALRVGREFDPVP